MFRCARRRPCVCGFVFVRVRAGGSPRCGASLDCVGMPQISISIRADFTYYEYGGVLVVARREHRLNTTGLQLRYCRKLHALCHRSGMAAVVCRVARSDSIVLRL
jgi:hypothetical protein